MENLKWCVNWMTTNHGGNGTHYSSAETLEEAIKECKQEYMYDHYTGLVIRPDLKITDVWQYVQYGDGELSSVIVPPCKVGEVLYLIQVDWNGKYNMQKCLVDSKITMLSILRAYEEKTVVYMSTDKSNTEQKLSELNGMRSESDLNSIFLDLR